MYKELYEDLLIECAEFLNLDTTFLKVNLTINCCFIGGHVIVNGITKDNNGTTVVLPDMVDYEIGTNISKVKIVSLLIDYSW